MLQPMKHKRTRPAPTPKPHGERKNSRRDHNNTRTEWSTQND